MLTILWDTWLNPHICNACTGELKHLTDERDGCQLI